MGSMSIGQRLPLPLLWRGLALEARIQKAAVDPRGDQRVIGVEEPRGDAPATGQPFERVVERDADLRVRIERGAGES